jgi:N-acetylglucosaminyl-diphospho-decaprenol L-rhamnosyltransferase
MKLLIVIVNYRVPTLAIDCLHSIATQIESVPNTRVAICENGSGDNSAQLLAEAINANGWDRWCTLKVVQENLGFTGGNNILIRPALGSDDPPEYVLLLNADTVVGTGGLKALVEFMDRHSRTGIAGSRLEDPDGTPQQSAFRFPSPLSEFEGSVRLGLVSRLLVDKIVAPPVSEVPVEADWVAGASMIVRREVFDQIGLLDEGYFTYFEDVDFCFNARKAGWGVWYVPASRVVHLVGRSSGITNKTESRLPSYSFEARRRYFLKNTGSMNAILADIGKIVGLMLWRLRVSLGKQESFPPHYLCDSILHSVFLTGFNLRNVKSPNRSS